jgi:hypothetical protein
MEIHEKIKFLRLTKDWSQEEVALKLDMSPNGYGSIFDDGKNVFNFNGNTQYSGQHNQSHFMGSCSPEYIKLQSDYEKSQLQVEMKDREIENLKEIIALLKNKLGD